MVAAADKIRFAISGISGSNCADKRRALYGTKSVRPSVLKPPSSSG